MIDIHSHIAPNLDDGSESLYESLTMINIALKNGTKKMVVTPHYLNEAQCRFDVHKSDIINAFESLKSYLLENNCPMEIFLGAEHFGITEIGRVAKKNELIPINGSRYILIEFDFEDDIRRVKYVLSQLQKYNYVPIIAHPERYVFFQDNPYEIYNFLESGCLLQVNKGSPLGKYGPEVERLSRWIFSNRIAHFVASDCHSPYQRTPEMESTHEALTMRFGINYSNRLFLKNPQKVLDNELIL